MYPTHHLETPPPASRFRRPWSPEPFDPNPLGAPRNDRLPGVVHMQGQREPSDVSFEALDLADYARTLNRNDLRTREAIVFHPYDPYPPSPQPLLPLSSRDSLASTPPLSPSLSTSQSYSTRSPGRAHRGQHRLFSFPTPQHSVGSHSNYSSRENGVQGYDKNNILRTPPAEPDAEIDIAQFPRFTRHWYNSGPTHPMYGESPMDIDIFDPGYSPHKANPLSSASNAYVLPYLPYQASHSSRDVAAVPWGNSSAEGPSVDTEVKEERVRMLEREFGKDDKIEEGEGRLVGSVDLNGRLITEGPKKRAATRWLQVLFALLGGGSSIYAALIIKNPTPPPPSGKPPAYILYVLSVITFFLTSYMFLIYPLCCARRKRKALDTPFTQGPGGMMVLPVSGLQGDKRKKKGKEGKEGGDGVQVNLIVDPGMFAGNMRNEDEDEDLSDTESSAPGTYSSSGRTRRRQVRRNKRRSVFAGLALEAQWKQARKMLKWGMLVDVFMLFAWGAEFVYILIGRRCPAGAFNGWCDAYNVATAAACLLCLLFGLGIFFDIKDLHASNTSPRTRTLR
ncbi:hypothetical protein BDY19DRAFT_989493 [Irpex rosettiformis]|uniref:Uncharacterized protein n=1 Tax=Irpex rosettiformis TaxID=378272 RepID=A0ACB8UJV2_9APHY|nr:hypothetical protein BDY19DRAFT_989493 [Irpex rosettiformis]